MVEGLYKDLTYKVIGLCMNLHKDLGSGFLESVYEKGLIYEFVDHNVQVENQVPLEVIHKGRILGTYKADIIVEDKVILELKAVNALNDAHRNQLLGYLKATGYKVGLLINFGAESLQYERIILSN